MSRHPERRDRHRGLAAVAASRPRGVDAGRPRGPRPASDGHHTPSVRQRSRGRRSDRLGLAPRGSTSAARSVTVPPSGTAAMASGRGGRRPATTGGGGDGGGLELCRGGRSGRSPRCRRRRRPSTPRQTPTGDPACPASKRTCRAWSPRSAATPPGSRSPAPRPASAPTTSATASSTRRDWITLTPDATGTLVPQITAADLVPGAYDQVVRRLPTPVPRIGPADEDDDGYAFVNVPTFFWLDRGPGQWHPVSAVASAGGVTVTVTAEPVRLVVDPGNGDAPVSCTGFQPVLRDDVRTGGFPAGETCSYRYLDSSAMAPNGQTWPVDGRLSPGTPRGTPRPAQGGDLGHVATTSPPGTSPSPRSRPSSPTPRTDAATRHRALAVIDEGRQTAIRTALTSPGHRRRVRAEPPVEAEHGVGGRHAFP